MKELLLRFEPVIWLLFGNGILIGTMLLTGSRRGDGLFEGTVDYAVGGGVVADSEPLAEYRESLDKAAVLRLACGAGMPA